MENETYNAIEKNPISKLERLMKNIKFAMMTTVDPDGSLFCRPMVCQQIPFDGNLWFSKRFLEFVLDIEWRRE